MTARRAAVLLAAVLLAAPLGGCAPDGQRTTRLTVLAAASLTDVLPAVDEAFEEQHPGVHVVPSFAGSSSLVSQVRSGAPADVLVTASAETMAAADGLVDAPVAFARNRLVLAVPSGSTVVGLADLGDPRLTVALCAEQVPCGAAAARVLAAAGVTVAADTYEQDVRAVLTKVRLGEVDAGLVYRTDVAAAGGAVRAIDLPPGLPDSTEYQAAVVGDSPAADLARAYVAHLVASDGVLVAAGFEAP